MSLVSNGTRALTNDELDLVTGGAIIEFRMGPLSIQMNTAPNGGGATVWNGKDPILPQPSLSHEPIHGR